MSISILVILAIVVAIAVGYITDINIGFFSIAFAYIIGALIMNLKPGDIVLMWPLKVFFILFAVTLFYNFAIINGTLEKLAMFILYKSRKHPSLLPFVIYAVALLISALGAGFYATMAFLCPLSLMLCEKIKMSRILGIMVVAEGAIGGGYFFTSVGGVIIKELIVKAGYAEQAVSYGFGVFMGVFIMSLVIVVGTYFFTKGYRLKSEDMDIEKPEEFTGKQRINLYLIVGLVVVILGPAIVNYFAPTNLLMKFLVTKMDIGFMALIASAMAFLFKLGDEKLVLSKVPWGTLVMICGVGMLIEIAVKAGTLNMLAGWLGTSIPAFLVPVAMVVICGVMSIFSSTLGVVLPTMYPLVPAIAGASGISPAILFIAVLIGSISTGMAPFSSGGALALASCKNDETRKELFPVLMFILPPAFLAVAVLQIYVFQIFM